MLTSNYPNISKCLHESAETLGCLHIQFSAELALKYPHFPQTSILLDSLKCG